MLRSEIRMRGQVKRYLSGPFDLMASLQESAATRREAASFLPLDPELKPFIRSNGIGTVHSMGAVHEWGMGEGGTGGKVGGVYLSCNAFRAAPDSVWPTLYSQKMTELVPFQHYLTECIH